MYLCVREGYSSYLSMCVVVVVVQLLCICVAMVQLCIHQCISVSGPWLDNGRLGSGPVHYCFVMPQVGSLGFSYVGRQKGQVGRTHGPTLNGQRTLAGGRKTINNKNHKEEDKIEYIIIIIIIAPDLT